LYKNKKETSSNKATMNNNNKNSIKQTTIEDLSYDLLRRSFVFCTLNDIIETLPFVSKHFYNSLSFDDSSWWKQVYMYYFGTSNTITCSTLDNYCESVCEKDDMCKTRSDWTWYQFVYRCYKANERYGMGKPCKCDVLEITGQRHPLTCVRIVNSFVESQGPSCQRNISSEYSFKYLICTSSDFKIHVWRRELCPFDAGKAKWECVHMKKGHYDTINNLEISRGNCTDNSITFFTSSYDKTINCWSLTNLGKEDEKLSVFQKLIGHTDRVKCILPSRVNFSRIISCSGDKTTKIWDIHEGKCVHDIHDKRMIWCLEEGGSTGQLFASVFTGGCDGKIELHSLKAMKPISFQAHSDIVSHMRFIPESNILISTSFDKSIKIWDMRMLSNGKPLHNIADAHAHSIISMSLDNNQSSQFVTCSADGWARVWNYKTGQLIQTLLTPKLLAGLYNTTPSLGGPNQLQPNAIFRQFVRGRSFPSGEHSVVMHHGAVLSNINGSDNLTYWSPSPPNYHHQIQPIPVGSYKPKYMMLSQMHSAMPQYQTTIRDFQMDSMCMVACVQQTPVGNHNSFLLSKSFLYYWDFAK
jgi:WD40 repeat protein